MKQIQKCAVGSDCTPIQKKKIARKPASMTGIENRTYRHALARRSWNSATVSIARPGSMWPIEIPADRRAIMRRRRWPIPCAGSRPRGNGAPAGTRSGRKRLLASYIGGSIAPCRRDFLQPSADPLVLYPFRFRDTVSGKWMRARYGRRAEIATRYAEWEIRAPGDSSPRRRCVHSLAVRKQCADTRTGRELNPGARIGGDIAPSAGTGPDASSCPDSDRNPKACNPPRVPPS